ncbi:hypothetical protein [Shinella sp.]|uniref:hypothetical protein n=1 Tax=Shinella sp. TaxID=1870904 RepID=UPI0029B34C33|nr:hypothetical protein [Shinella sp.]MDX3973314.1 hypothetical protein [Shinella sp.]
MTAPLFFNLLFIGNAFLRNEPSHECSGGEKEGEAGKDAGRDRKRIADERQGDLDAGKKAGEQNKPDAPGTPKHGPPVVDETHVKPHWNKRRRRSG